LSAAIKSLISLRRFCDAATSKKPPQVRELVGGGGQLGGNRFKHGGRIQETEFRSQNGK